MMKYSSNTIGTVVRLHAKKCLVVSDADGQEVACMLRGRLFEKSAGETKPVAVGDRVSFRITAQGAALEKILPRTNALHRPAVGRRNELHTIAANINRMIIVASLKDPPLRTGLVDRFLVAAGIEEIEGVICLNKIDLLDPGCGEVARLEETEKLYEGLGYRVYATSALEGTGVDRLSEELRQGVSLIMGHSGVGKSTLINRIDPGLALKTGSISAKQRKGRHTTTSVSLLPMEGGGFVVDTPGIREFGISRIEANDVGHFYPEIAARLPDCRYNNCTHRHEPDCAVLEALNTGEISEARYASYLRIVEELEAKRPGTH